MFISGNDKYSYYSRLLFDDIIKHSKKQTATWNDFIDCLMQNLNPKIHQKVTFAINQIEKISHAKVDIPVHSV